MRFPLLDAYLLSSTAAERRAAAQAKMEPVKANFEFSAFVDQEGLSALASGAESRKMTLWTNPEDPGVRVFGAGMVAASDVAGVTIWLKQAAPLRKLATAVHPNEGATKFFEYYPSAQ